MSSAPTMKPLVTYTFDWAPVGRLGEYGCQKINNPILNPDRVI